MIMKIYKIELTDLKIEEVGIKTPRLCERFHRDADGELDLIKEVEFDYHVENRHWMEVNVYSAILPVDFTVPTGRRLPVESRTTLNPRFDDKRELSLSSLNWVHEGSFDVEPEDLVAFGESKATIHNDGYIILKYEYNHQYDPKYVIVDGCDMYRTNFDGDILWVTEESSFRTLIESL